MNTGPPQAKGANVNSQDSTRFGVVGQGPAPTSQNLASRQIEVDCLQSLARNPETRAREFPLLGPTDFWFGAHPRIFAVMRDLWARDLLHVAVEIRIAGVPTTVQAALGRPDATAALTCPAMRRALEIVSPNPGRDLLTFEDILRTGLTAGAAAFERLRELGQARRLAIALDDAYRRLVDGEPVDDITARLSTTRSAVA